MIGKQDFWSGTIYVIIAAYNCQNYLEDAVDSVLKQNNITIHIVIVDDGSTDKTPLMIDNMAYNNEKVHALHKVNGGVSSARNMGIQYVLSISKDNDYIAFLDADDAWNFNFFDDEITHILSRETDLIGFQSALCNDKLTMRAPTVDIKEGFLKEEINLFGFMIHNILVQCCIHVTF